MHIELSVRFDNIYQQLIYNMQRAYGKEFDLEDVKRAYQSFNPQKKVPTRIKKDSEKTQLLWFISDAEEGLIA